MARSIAETNVALKATAAQFVSEFRRADNEARRAGTSIDREVSKLSRSLNKKFSLGDIGKSVLGGFGLGSGFAIAQTAAEAIAGYWKEAAEAAQSIEESTAAQLESVRKLIALNQSDAQKAGALEAAVARAQREYEASTRPRTEQVQVGGNLNMRFESRTRAFTQKELAEQQRLLAEWKKLDLQLAESRKQTEKAVAKEREDGVKAAMEWEREMNEDILAAIEMRRKAEAEAMLEEIKYRADLAAAEQHLLDLQEKRMKAVGAALDEFFGELDKKSASLAKEEAKEAEQAARELGLTFQSAFEDAIVEGRKLSDVLKGLAQDILRIAVRRSLTEPLGDWLGGLFGGKKSGGGLGGIFGALGGLFGGGKAAGGPVESGRAYLVGERGPELMVPAASGQIVPNHALGVGRRGGTFYIDARGADRTGLARLESMIRALHGSIEPRALAAVADARRRGPSFV